SAVITTERSKPAQKVRDWEQGRFAPRPVPAPGTEPATSEGHSMPITHHVRVHPSSDDLPREDQLAWKLAELAADPAPVPSDVADMVINRAIDNTAVAAASLLRAPVVAARAQALDHPFSPGATVYGRSSDLRVSPEWAAWANGVAVRELDFHDTFLAADYSHPGDNIPPLLAVAQHTGATGADLVHAIATAY